VISGLAAMDISESRNRKTVLSGAKLVATLISRRHRAPAGENWSCESDNVGRLQARRPRCTKLVEQVRGLVTQPHGMFLCCADVRQIDHADACPRNRSVSAEYHHGEDPIEYQLTTSPRWR
jgi:hypothetical protein